MCLQNPGGQGLCRLLSRCKAEGGAPAPQQDRLSLACRISHLALWGSGQPRHPEPHLAALGNGNGDSRGCSQGCLCVVSFRFQKNTLTSASWKPNSKLEFFLDIVHPSGHSISYKITELQHHACPFLEQVRRLSWEWKGWPRVPAQLGSTLAYLCP